ncbi:MAG: hypothetical protein SFV24_20260 [Gemmatimonadales bacterium]|nr:hypothetical protein [Gemmatimonadales bacterium]
MIVIEKATKLLFAALFGWLVVALAVETLVRRRLAARRRKALEEAYLERPCLRPTVEWEVRRAGASPGAQA